MRRPGVLIVLVSAIWGSSYLLIKVALHDLSAEAIVFARVASGALVLVPIAWRAGALRGLRPYLPRLAVVALLQVTAPVWLIALGEQWISSALAGLLNGTVPIFVALFALVVDRSERATRARVAGITLGFAGVALVLGLDVRLGLFTLVGAVCLTGASVGYALGPLYAKRHLGGLPPVGIVASLMAFATLYTLPGLAIAPPRQVPSLAAITAVAALGVVGTGLGFLLYYRVMQRIGPGRASVIGYLVTGFAVVYGVALLGDRVGVAGLAGLGLIVAGSVVASRAQGVPARLRERQAAPEDRLCCGAVDLYEHQGKELLETYGVPVGEGRVATTPAEARDAAAALGGGRVVVKAQVLTGGRGKAGGVKVAESPDDAEAKAAAILGLDIKGHVTRRVYVEKAIDIAHELYFSITFDRAAKRALFMLSTMGGMDIEAVAVEHPDKLARLHLDPAMGLQPFFVRRLLFTADVPKEQQSGVAAVIAKTYGLFSEGDAMLVEINPLVVTGDGSVIAADAKVTIDDSSLFRHPDVAAMRDVSAADPQEQMAHERGITYVKLDGSIGVLGNGAGLVMSTLDVVDQVGGSPANFLDVGGGADADKIVTALEVVLSDDRVRAVFFNIFGGITRCDEVARGIITALGQLHVPVPIVVRLDGTNDVEGRELLANAGLDGVHVERTMLEAARRVVELAKAG